MHACMPYLQDVEVALKVLPKWVLASSDAVEEQHAIAVYVCGVALPGVPATARYQLLWCLPPTAATCINFTCMLPLAQIDKNWMKVGRTQV